MSNPKKKEISKLDLSLLFACSSQYLSFAELKQFIKKGANPELVHQSSGKSSFHYLVFLNNEKVSLDMIKYLIEVVGVDPELKDNYGNTLLHLAAFNDNISVLKYLTENSISNVDSQNHAGETPIFGIQYSMNIEMTKALLDAGADVTIKTYEGIDIVEEIADYGTDELLELLNDYKYQNSTDESVEIYNQSKAEQMLEEINSDESSLAPHLEAMCSGESRRFLKGVDSDVHLKLEELKFLFPNFSNVIDYVSKQVSLMLLSESPSFQMKPLLMTGSPGVGKTRFTKELSKALGLSFGSVDGGNTTGAQAFGGSDSVWRDSKPGKICDFLIKSQFANSIFMIDEIDKISGSVNSDPYGPLYSLLEDHSSKVFIDDFYRIPFDCSHLIWIATANEVNTIPEPILDRFTVIKVMEPTKEQMPQIINSVYSDIVNSESNPWGRKFDSSLSDDVVSSLENETPRKIRQRLMSAMGEKAHDFVINNKDNDKIELDVESLKSKTVKKVRFGF